MTHRATSCESCTRSHEGDGCSLIPQVCQSWSFLVDTIALRIRRSLALPELLQSSVDEVQHLLRCDRVLIYCVDAHWNGRVVAEAVSDPQWSVMDRVIHDACFESSWLESYRERHYFAVEDIATANLTPCHLTA
jgi:GAF domain-containing protein